MKIVTWNCNGAFRTKFSHLDEFNADILIIQECEDPSRSQNPSYQEWAKNYLWKGASKNKGLGVFSREGIALIEVPLALEPLELFLPCLVGEESIPLLAVWTKQANSPTFRYIGQLWKFLQSHRSFLNNPSALLIGDLNSNAIWDVWDRWWNHSDVIRELALMGIESCYHQFYNEEQGKEQRHTFFLHRRAERHYHIDYAFAGPQWDVEDVFTGTFDNWKTLSDHIPLVTTLKIHA